MPKTPEKPIDLDGFFAAEKQAVNEPSTDFMARVLRDAEDIQDAFAPQAPSPKPKPIWEALIGAIGGWRSVAGLATATIVGVWIGVSPPESLDGLASFVWSEDAVSYAEYLPNYDYTLLEGQL
ncbi:MULTISPECIES: hypothetical protein [Halocynthiibacter]|uniref:Dihydroorotate dehydrogenase n=1 Tax=Halocynthiibacter halioticoli TaxID=2986804 RepID=A0AAE3IZ35_9RHOB|nr:MULTISPECIES: hypothetical protein [Halocynthiibacter]MCV6824977.1 hypothetical protein [Halocynthiibacter halioticoli]MCW4057978.1 hypothetical protein [Halocynthiibacter sp. SDUM655004]